MTGTVVAEVGNPGPGAAAGAFAVTFFEDRNSSGAFEAADDLVLGTATAGALGPGEILRRFGRGLGDGAVLGQPRVRVRRQRRRDRRGQRRQQLRQLGPGVRVHAAGARGQPGARMGVDGIRRGAAVATRSGGSPLVIDLDLDGSPEIVFQTNKSNGFTDYASEGSLRAVNGATHAEVFTTGGPDRWLNSMVHDRGREHRRRSLSRDHRRRRRASSHLIAFEHDGTLKWRSAPIERTRLGTDRAGRPRRRRRGRDRARAPGAERRRHPALDGDRRAREQRDFFGPSATVVDLDLDGRPEVVARQHRLPRLRARSRDRSSGKRLSAPGGHGRGRLHRGGQLRRRPQPGDRARRPDGVVWMLEHDGAVKWGPVVIPGERGFGSRPAIGNLDDDPELEFVVGGRETVGRSSRVTATVAWTAPAATASEPGGRVGGALRLRRRRRRPRSSSATSTRCASSAAARSSSSARTWGAARGSVVIADADGDGKPEIVLTDNGAPSVLPGAAALPRLRRLRRHLGPVAADLEPVRVPRLERERRRHRSRPSRRGRWPARAQNVVRARRRGHQSRRAARTRSRTSRPPTCASTRDATTASSHRAHRQRRGRGRRRRRPRHLLRRRSRRGVAGASAPSTPRR